jgi:hypothetical protein
MRTERTDRRGGELNAAESDQPAATGVDAGHDVEGCDARGPARPKAKDRDDSAGKRGRQMNARLVRMHGGLIVRGGQ